MSLLSQTLVFITLSGAWTLAAAESPFAAELPAAAEAPIDVPITSPESSPPVVIPPEVATAVAELQSKDFAVRQQARNRLIALGAPAFKPLIAALDNVPGDTGIRILLIIEKIWLQTPESQADVLEQQLDDLSNTVTFFYWYHVKRMLGNHHRLREERAVRSLRRLNAVVQLDRDDNDRELRAKLDVDLSESKQRIVTVILPRSWKGTSADLWHIRRLSHTEIMQVFYVRGINLTEADRLTMRLGFSELGVSERAEIFIGVMGNAVSFDDRGGCPVTGVQPDSPAQIAGIQVGDRIMAVDGVEIKNFEDLVEQLKSKRGYQPIEMTVERFAGEEPSVITVIGLPWEVRSFPTPPPPPQAESLLEPPAIQRGRVRSFPN